MTFFSYRTGRNISHTFPLSQSWKRKLFMYFFRSWFDIMIFFVIFLLRNTLDWNLIKLFKLYKLCLQFWIYLFELLIFKFQVQNILTLIQSGIFHWDHLIKWHFCSRFARAIVCLMWFPSIVFRIRSIGSSQLSA